MPLPILATKFFIPALHSKGVIRPRLLERLNEGLRRKLTLISAPAGFGKTTLVAQWATQTERSVAWLSLDQGENNPTQFLAYLIAAIQKVAPQVGISLLAALHTSQPPPTDVVLTMLLNDLSQLSTPCLLILDDYHSIDSKTVDADLYYFIDHLPSSLHLVMITREDPDLPLARLRALGQLTEIRANDLRFTPEEAISFSNEVMGLNLSSEESEALDARTEGWIVGLQLAAISMQGRLDTADFIKSFTGNHQFVLDYLMEEVLHRQNERVQAFLLQTAILDRMSGSLCDALLLDVPGTGQETLAQISRANLFIIPLDQERRWYRYHHLFADLLRQRLYERRLPDQTSVTELHLRASLWFEEQGLEIEAFQHATKSNHIDRAAYLIEGKGMPLYFRGHAPAILAWLKTLPKSVLQERPNLCVAYASALLFVSQISGIEEVLQIAETALDQEMTDPVSRDLIGRIASIRATIAVALQRSEVILQQSQRALEYLHPSNLPVRAATVWQFGFAQFLSGNLIAAQRAYTESLASSEKLGHTIIRIMSILGLGQVAEQERKLSQAAHYYQQMIQFGGEPPSATVCEAYLGLARLAYERNELEAAQRYWQQSIPLARLIENTDRVLACEIFLARLRLARGEDEAAAIALKKASQQAVQHGFVLRLPEIAELQLRLLIQQGNVLEANQIAKTQDNPFIQARLALAQGDGNAALRALEPLESRLASGWVADYMKGLALQALAFQTIGNVDAAVRAIETVLHSSEPEGCLRLFIDEGQPMLDLLIEANRRHITPAFTARLIALMQGAQTRPGGERPASDFLIEPLSRRELEILQLVAEGLSNQDIGERLYLALDTVKGHNRRIFEKLQVQRRTEAVARARALKLL